MIALQASPFVMVLARFTLQYIHASFELAHFFAIRADWTSEPLANSLA